MGHPRLNIERWMREVDLPRDPAACDRLVRHVSGPLALATAELLRREVGAHLDPRAAVPTDVFIWSVGGRTDPCLTKLGGVPHLPAGTPWPKDTLGRPMVFVGQVCFVDSHDLVPPLLHGKTLLVFAPRRPPGEPQDVEWLWFLSSVGLLVEAGPMEAWPASRCPPEGLLGIELFGVIHRTSNYRVGNGVLDKVGLDRSGWYLTNYSATQIGALPYFQQGDPWGIGLKALVRLSAAGFAALPLRVVAMIDSVHVDERWPFVDVERWEDVPPALRGSPVSPWAYAIEDAGSLYASVRRGKVSVGPQGG